MEPARGNSPPVWQLAIPFAVVAVWRAYIVAHSPPDARPSQILATIVALGVGIAMCIYYFRRRRADSANRQFSTTTLLLIALGIIVIAIVFRHI